MATIKKMKISGIRSYPPDNKGGVIEFNTPLTLIVGPNGTGKTSIIESLNYVVANNLPPGCKNNAFIHDPKVAGQKEVKGQVQLKFVDMVGNTIHATRSMKSTQKFAKVETKSLDGVIYKQVPGEKEAQSISSRCTDFTKEMISRLGVSKAVIENVIFCHQEDSNWPLSEGKILKQKFDAIFAATRYIKALECIRNLRKEQGQEVKIITNDLGHLSTLKAKADEVASDLSKAEVHVKVFQDDIVKLTKKTEPIEGTLLELDEVSGNIAQVENKIVKLQSTKDEKKRNMSNLEKQIENVFNGTIAELKELSDKSEDNLSNKQKNLSNLEVLIRRLQVEVDRLLEKKTGLDKEHGKLQQEAEQHQTLVEERNKLIVSMADLYKLDGYNKHHFSQKEADSFVLKIKEIFVHTVTTGKEKKGIISKEYEESEEKIKKLEKSLYGYQGAIDQKQKVVKSNIEKLKEINDQLAKLDASENRLQHLNDDMKRAQLELDEFKKELNISKAQDEIDRIAEQKKTDTRDLEQLRKEERILMQQSETQTKVEMLNKNKSEKEDNVENILRRHHNTMETIFESSRPPKHELKLKLQEFIRKKQAEVRKGTREYQNCSQDIARKEANMKMLLDEQHKTELEMSQNKQELDETCVENDYNEMREYLQKKVELNSNKLVELSSFERIYRKYISDLQSDEVNDAGCPLCHRKFERQRAIKELIDELAQRLQTVPEKRELVKIELDEYKFKNQKVLDLAPVKARYDKLFSEAPKLTKQIDEISKIIEKQKMELSTIEKTKAASEEGEGLGRSMEQDINKVDDIIYDLKDLDLQINMESSKLHGVSSGRTMRSLQDEVQNKQSEVDSLSSTLDKKRERLSEHQRQLSHRERKANDLTSQKLILESELQKRLQLQTQEADLKSTNQAYQREIKEASSQIQPIKAKLKDEHENKEEIELRRDQNADEITSKLENIKRNGDKIRDRNDRIQRYIKDGGEDNIRDNESQLKNVEGRLRDKNDEQIRRKQERTIIQDEIAKQDLYKRELEDNLQLLNTKQEVKSLDSKIVDLGKELSRFGDYKVIRQRRSDLQDELDRYRSEKAGIEGRLKGFEEEVRKYKRELRSTMYADADGKHCQKMIELRTTELANQDLDKYYKALDSAIMKYHGLKLAEINKIVKEYWIKTYKGHDIDTIEIVAESDADDRSGASKARRSYNYRVCMVKGETSLDMRGRCSAGQKVIASIIIRLALAETFCLNCGILALDEPTTNLDAENIQSLAYSLRDIIEMRMQQKNFQLIVITHDEEFVAALGGSDFVEHYFRVYKDAEGHSKIHKMRMVDKE